VWGQCCWIGGGWCEKSKIPHVSDAGMGVQSKIPHVSDAGMGVKDWFLYLANRLEKVRVIHGDWSRCLNHHYGGEATAIFFDPPYKGFESLYHKDAQKKLVAEDVENWCRDNSGGIKISLCGHAGDYDLPGWDVFLWSRKSPTYGGTKTTDQEAIWFSPSCEKIKTVSQEVMSL